MPAKYSIAETLFQVNLRYDPYHKYEKFLTDNINSPGKLEITFGDAGFFADEYLRSENEIQWYHDAANHLCVRVVDQAKRIVMGYMVVSDDYRSARIKHRYFDKLFAHDFIDLFMFLFFQINLLFTPGVCIHAAAINWKNKGILFSAPSETGKSTQAKLWCEHEGAEIINADRPAITIKKGGFSANGTPWTGTDPIVNNISRPIRAIVMLEQSPENVVERLSPEEAVNLLLPRVFMPYFDEQLTVRALDIVDQIIQKVPIYQLKCRPDVGAVEVLKKELSLLPE